MSVEAMSQVWEHSKAKGSALLLLLAIADNAHDDGTNAWPGIKTLAAKIRMTERNVQHLLRKLEKSGELVTLTGEGKKGTNLYAICVGELGVKPASPLGVKSFHRGGEVAFTGGVKPASPKPSLEPSNEKNVVVAPPPVFEQSDLPPRYDRTPAVDLYVQKLGTVGTMQVQAINDLYQITGATDALIAQAFELTSTRRQKPGKRIGDCVAYARGILENLISENQHADQRKAALNGTGKHNQTATHEYQPQSDAERDFIEDLKRNPIRH